MPTTPEPPASDFSIVFDTSVLSNFAICGQVELLERLYRDQACTTLMVAEEIGHGLEAGYRYLEAVEEILGVSRPAGWMTVVPLVLPEEQKLYLEFSASLASGEASCLALAVQRGLTVATDDLAARRLAQERQIALTGTLGILIRLVREGLLSLETANDLLKRMIALRYRSPVERLDDLV